MSIASTLQCLEVFPAQLEAFLDDLPPGALDFRPAAWEGIPSEALTIRQQLCHLRDIEADGYLVRFARVLGETDPELESIDPYALIERRRYDATDPRDALGTFAEARHRTLSLLAGLDREALARTGRFEGYGPVTLRGLIHFLCSHDQQHLAGIQWLIGQQASAAAEVRR